MRIIYMLYLLVNPAISIRSFCDTDGNWQKVWADQFQTKLDQQSWLIDLDSDDSLVRNSVGTRENVYIENGSLVLRSQRQNYKGHNFTSAAVSTINKVAFKGPARVCIRAKLPGSGSGKSNGIWPAHWMMPQTNECWPTNGEIDIMEMVNGDGILYGTYHYGNSCNEDFGKGGAIRLPQDWYDRFIEYAVEYSPTTMKWYVDGNLYYEMPAEAVKLYDVPYYIMLNTALGGPWPSPVDDSTQFPAYHVIDYVRVARLTSKQNANK